MDNDDAGRRAFNTAEGEGLATLKNITYTICNGSPDAELEDCYNKTFYETILLEEFGVNINASEFRGNKKWSDRIADCFKSQGKPWNDSIEKRVKYAVAEAVPEDHNVALNLHKRSSIDALVSALEALLP